MPERPISLVHDGNWSALVSTCFPSDTQEAVGDDLVTLLSTHGEVLQQLYEQYDARAEETSATRMSAYFPTAEAPTHKPLSEIPHVTRAIVTALYAQQRMAAYVTQVDEDAAALQSYLERGDTDHGEQLYNWLLYDRVGDDLDQQLASTLANTTNELAGYDDETAGVKDLGLANSGLSTRNAINCLDDFSGRTFPFIRATCEATDNATRVLDIGTGTGVLAAIAAINEPETVVGIEINPITAILARRVIYDLEQTNLIPEDTVSILWGDALRFGTEEYQSYVQSFDTVISENLSTGMFYEPQTQVLQHVREADLVADEATTVPHALASGIELVSLDDGYTPASPAETLLRVQDRGGTVQQVATRTVPYDYIDFTGDTPTNIMATVREEATATTTIDAIAIHSVIKLGETDYVKRNQNTFLNHDLLLHLSDSLDVYTGDDIITGLAYSYGNAVDSGIFEVYHRNAGGDPDARFAIPIDVHEQNKTSFRSTHGFTEDQDLRLGNLMMDERIRCRRATDGEQDIWRQMYNS